jgi:hypothetical protein
MNQKKENIINNEVSNFIHMLEKLDSAYRNNNEVNIYKLPCIVEREATRLYTHYEDWTTINNDLEVMDKIKSRIQDIELNSNLKEFIKEQDDYELGMMYYTARLLSISKAI